MVIYDLPSECCEVSTRAGRSSWERPKRRLPSCVRAKFGEPLPALRPQLERETKTVRTVECDADRRSGAVEECVRTRTECDVEQLLRADHGEERQARNRSAARHELKRVRLPRNRSRVRRIRDAKLLAENSLRGDRDAAGATEIEAEIQKDVLNAAVATAMVESLRKYAHRR